MRSATAHRPTTARRRRTAILSSLASSAFVAALLVGNVGVASASSPAKTQTPLQKGMAYYQGKTVNFLLPSAAGSPYDILYRSLTQQMGTFLHATINVIDNASGAGVAAQDQLASSQPDGLTIGQLNLGTDYYDLIANTPYVNFNPVKLDIFGVPTGFGTQVIYTQPNSPYQSVPALQHATTPVRVCMYGSLTATDTTLFLRTFGIKNFSYVFGYTSGSGEATGFLRGDCQIIATSIGQFESQIVAHTLTVLAVLAPGTTLKPYAPAGITFMSSYPTAAQLEAKYLPKTTLAKKAANLLASVVLIPNNALSAPARTPTYIIDALVAAMKYGLSVPSVSTLFHSQVISGRYQSGTLTRTLFSNALKNVKAIQSIIG